MDQKWWNLRVSEIFPATKTQDAAHSAYYLACGYSNVGHGAGWQGGNVFLRGKGGMQAGGQACRQADRGQREADRTGRLDGPFRLFAWRTWPRDAHAAAGGSQNSSNYKIGNRHGEGERATDKYSSVSSLVPTAPHRARPSSFISPGFVLQSRHARLHFASHWLSPLPVPAPCLRAPLRFETLFALP